MHKSTEIALGEVGYIEKSKAAYTKNPDVLFNKLAGAGSDNYTKYGKEMHDILPSVMDFPAFWCDAFVDWCFYKAYGIEDAKRLLGGNFNDYTKSSVNYYTSTGKFTLRSKRVPEEGCQIFFSSNGEFSGVNHTGIVLKVEKNSVITIEGNTSAGDGQVVPNGGMVCQKSYSLGNSRIYGYGWPDYESVENVQVYKKGTTFDIVSYVGKDFVTPSTGKLTCTMDVRIRKEPDFDVRDRWFKTPLGFVSAYVVEGDVTDSFGTWTERDGHKWPRLCAEIQNGIERHYDKNGYILVPSRLSNSGAVIYS